MMKTLVTVGALAVAGLALAGTAAADCTYEQPGVMDYDYLQLCTLESSSYSDPYYSYSTNSPLNAYYYGYGPDGYAQAGSSVSQYAYEYCWSNPCESGSGSSAGAFTSGCNSDLGCYGLGAGMNQYQYESSWGAFKGFNFGVDAGLLGEYVYLSYNQYGSTNSCTEQAYVGGSVTGFNEIVSPQDCLVPIEQLPELPAL